MEIGSIFLILALLVLIALFVGRPLFDKVAMPSSMEQDQSDSERSALLAERDRILSALQELDFDHVLGKIPEQDYPAQRALMVKRGADVLRRLDNLASPQAHSGTVQEPTGVTLTPQPAMSSANPGLPDAEQRLEADLSAGAAIAAPRAEAAMSPAGAPNGRKQLTGIAGPDDNLEVLLANRRRMRQEKAVGFCPQCGCPVQKSDRFCPKCGSNLA